MQMILCLFILSFAAVNRISAENCPSSAGVILINKTNKTIPKEYLKDFNEIEKVLSEQAKTKNDINLILEEILPHNYVPKISTAEKGEILSFSINLRQGRIASPTTTLQVLLRRIRSSSNFPLPAEKIYIFRDVNFNFLCDMILSVLFNCSIGEFQVDRRMIVVGDVMS